MAEALKGSWVEGQQLRVEVNDLPLFLMSVVQPQSYGQGL